jgi:hypothetical protein
MRLWTLPFRLLGIFVLAGLVSGAWLFRAEILRLVRPQVARVTASLGAGGAGRPGPAALARARDKVDSLHGWGADSVVLNANEMAALLADGLSREAREHVDSITLELGDSRVTVSARLETAQIPTEALGPLAGALEPWERVSAAGPVRIVNPGQAEWHADALTLRGFTLPEETSHRLVDRALPGAANGIVPLTLPKGVAGLRVRPDGVSLYRQATP